MNDLLNQWMILVKCRDGSPQPLWISYSEYHDSESQVGGIIQCVGGDPGTWLVIIFQHLFLADLNGV